MISVNTVLLKQQVHLLLSEMRQFQLTTIVQCLHKQCLKPMCWGGRQEGRKEGTESEKGRDNKERKGMGWLGDADEGTVN